MGEKPELILKMVIVAACSYDASWLENFSETRTDFNSKRKGRSGLCCIKWRLNGDRVRFARCVILR